MNNGIIEKREHYGELFDCYENLFTEKQTTYFREYYYYDLTLAEIAANHGVSRAAVYDTIKKTHKFLDDYEAKLGLSARRKRFFQLCDEYEEKEKDNKAVLGLIVALKESGEF